MVASASSDVPHPVVDPTPDEVYAAMTPGEPYVVADLLAHFDDIYDTNKNTIRNRLEYLVEEDKVRRKKHQSRTVTYRRLY